LFKREGDVFVCLRIAPASPVGFESTYALPFLGLTTGCYFRQVFFVLPVDWLDVIALLSLFSRQRSPRTFIPPISMVVERFYADARSTDGRPFEMKAGRSNSTLL
jgi:hypothetical protein